MATIEMKETRLGSQDGWVVEEFENGKRYEVVPSLASRFIRMGAAVLIQSEQVEGAAS